MIMVMEGGRAGLRRHVPPGPATWGGGRLLGGLNRPLVDFQPVLALTILRQTDRGPQILVGVRNPETNKTHQNVASVPTRRVRHTVATRWLRSMRTRRPLSPSECDDLGGEVSHTFSLKLGLADAQERGRVRFEVKAFGAYQGVSVIGERPEDGQPVTENLTMFNTVIALEHGHDLVPSDTASYRPLVWAGIDDFIEMAQSRDTGRLNAGLEDAFFCAYGLCLQTSVLMLGPVHALAHSTR